MPTTRTRTRTRTGSVFTRLRTPAWLYGCIGLVGAALVVAAVGSAAPAGAAVAAPVQRYRFVSIPALGSNVFGTYNTAPAINSAGEVVGESSLPSGAHPYTWRNGNLADLGILRTESTFAEGGALGVNDVGTVVGATQVNGPGNTGQHAFADRQGTLVDLGTGYPGVGSGSAAVAVNEHGLIVGYHYASQDVSFRAVVWDRGRVRELPDLGGPDTPYGLVSQANAVNNVGQVVGVASVPVTGHGAAGVLWDQGRIRDLGNLGGTGEGTSANDINDQGVVVGRSWTGQSLQAFIWRTGVMRKLRGLGPEDPQHASEALGINNVGTVVGDSQTFAEGATLAATIWRNGVPTDLNTLVVGIPPGEHLAIANAINDNGAIVGALDDGTGGHLTAFKLVPLP